jgi:hypothetical protein
MPKTITIDDDLYTALVSSIGTENLREKVRKIFILALEAILEKYTREILLFEEKYGMSFEEFETLWDGNKITDKHSYETESDFIDWEMLEMEKKDLLSLIKELKDISPHQISERKDTLVFNFGFSDRDNRRGNS